MTQTSTWTPHGLGARLLPWILLLGLLFCALPACAMRAAVDEAAVEEGSTRYVVMLRPEARFYGRPDASGASVGLSISRAPVGEPFGVPMERMEVSDDGEWVRVRNLDESRQRTCGNTRYWRGVLTGQFAVDAWVPVEFLMPHVVRRSRTTYADGTWLELQAGTAVHYDKTGLRWAVLLGSGRERILLPWGGEGVGLVSEWQASVELDADSEVFVRPPRSFIVAGRTFDDWLFLRMRPLCGAFSGNGEAAVCALVETDCYTIQGIATSTEAQPFRRRFSGDEVMPSTNGEWSGGGAVYLPDGTVIGELNQDALYWGAQPSRQRPGMVCTNPMGIQFDYVPAAAPGADACENCVCFAESDVLMHPVWQIADQLGIRVAVRRDQYGPKRGRPPCFIDNELAVEVDCETGEMAFEQMLVAYLYGGLSWWAFESAGMSEIAVRVFKWDKFIGRWTWGSNEPFVLY